MNRWKWILIGLALILGIALHQGIRAQLPVKTREAQPIAPAPKPQGSFGSAVEIGPDEQGAVLRLPGAPQTPPEPEPQTPVRQQPPAEPREQPNANLNGLPESLRNSYNPAVLPPGGSPVVRPANRVALPPVNFDDVNRDIEVTAEAGQWVLMMMAYTGEKAPEYARKFTFALRNRFKLNAYVFNFGAEEKRKEYERVNAEREKQRKALKDAGVPDVDVVPLRIRAVRYEQQVGVLVGGFKTREEALAAKAKLRKHEKEWKSEDAVEFAFDLVYKETPELDKTGKETGRFVSVKAYDNPFFKAFPARNPMIKNEDIEKERHIEEVKFMRKINEKTPFCLLDSPRMFTLVIKQFSSQHKYMGDNAPESKSAMRKFIDQFDGFHLFKKGEWTDYAGHNAHNLAEGLRKAGLPETYVLHCRHCSYVTVGGYDRIDDPQLIAMQNYLTTRFQEPAFRSIDMMPRPAIMPIPR